MPTEISNIDDFLIQVQNNTTTPPSPEQMEVAAQDENVSQEVSEAKSEYVETETSEQITPDEPKQEVKAEENSPVDEYGNEAPKPRLYTDEEVNERINQAVRDRLARGNHSQATQEHMQQAAAQNFQYDENAEGNWQQQLAKFIRQEFANMHQEQTQQQYQQREEVAQAEFQYRFQEGVKKFQDFAQVVDTERFSQAMVMATRGLKDPAAFVYAASKRAPQEIERISKIQDPYAQILEMGKLEERLKKSPPVSKTPKPVAKIKDDVAIPHSSSSEPTVDDMIAESNAKRLQLVNSRRR